MGGVIQTVRENPQAVSKALIACAVAAATAYCTLRGKPEAAGPTADYLNSLVGVFGTALTVAAALASSVHWSRGPVPMPGQLVQQVKTSVEQSVPPAVTAGIEKAIQESAP